MFDQLFFSSDALTRQLSAPLVDQRRQYLAQCLAQGMPDRPHGPNGFLGDEARAVFSGITLPRTVAEFR